MKDSLEAVLLPATSFDLGVTGLADIVQCLRTIASTRIGTVPMDREFGLSWSWVDAPEPVAMARFRSELVEAIDRWEPRVKVLSVSFRRGEGMTGRLVPVIRFRIADGVEI